MTNQVYEIKNRRTRGVLFSYEVPKWLPVAMIERYAVVAAINSGVKLINADLRNTNLIGANLVGANFMGVDLEGANLTGADARGANFKDAYLINVKLTGADFRGANFRGTKLTGTSLMGSNFRNADFTDAYLENIDLEDASFRNANFTDAYLENINLNCANLEGVVGDMRYIKTMQFDKWRISYTFIDLQIGCQKHPIIKWKNWRNKPGWIDEMSGGATEWAEKCLDLVLQIIEVSPAVPYNRHIK